MPNSKAGRSDDQYANMPMVIEIIDDKSKLEPLLPQIKMMVDDNGIVTLHEVDSI
jgi:PII-like signaling protein